MAVTEEEEEEEGSSRVYRCLPDEWMAGRVRFRTTRKQSWEGKGEGR